MRRVICIVADSEFDVVDKGVSVHACNFKPVVVLRRHVKIMLNRKIIRALDCVVGRKRAVEIFHARD